jgi:hypothetical protein
MGVTTMRARLLAAYGASASQIDELLTYNTNTFDHSQLTQPLTLPLTPEPHVATWEGYAAEARGIGTFAALRKRLVQLSFPIQDGISQRQTYRDATRRGIPVESLGDATGLDLEQPERLQLRLYDNLAGRLPVLIPGCRADFVTLVQALSRHNEPHPIPDSMGACTVSGYNNWDRIRTLRQAWETAHPLDFDGWVAEFQRLIPQKHMYQDRFMIISDGLYSNVAATDMELSSAAWQRLSVTIRMEHECTHYFTRRVFGAMRNNAFDELIADYFGIVTAVGTFQADWLLRFMGLEAFPAYREGGRLQNYLGTPPLSDGAFTVLQALVRDAALHLERFDTAHSDVLRSPEQKASLMLALTSLTLEELAAPEAESRLYQAWQAARQS